MQIPMEDKFSEIFNDPDQLKSILKRVQYEYFEPKFYKLEEMQFLIEHGADPRTDNDAPLYLASGFYNKNVLEYFIYEHNANINAKVDLSYICETITNRTSNDCINCPLAIAIYENRIDNVKYLLELGAIIDDDVITAASHREISCEIIKILVDYGMDIRKLAELSISEIYSNDIDKLKYFHENGLDIISLIFKI